MQIFLDLCVASFTIYWADGLHSWLWVTFTFITLEVAFVFKSVRHVLYICFAEGIAYGFIVLHGAGSSFHAQPSSSFYYGQDILDVNVHYQILAWFWVIVSNLMVGVLAAKSFNALGEREVSLKYLAAKDALTGLYNQGYFLEAIKNELQRSLRYNRPFAFLMIDLDNFKKFNDTYGHQEGNRLLKCVGEILSTSIRRSVTHPTYDIDIACRFGGEEFAIILPEVQHVNEAFIVAERIRSKIDQLDLDGKRTSASIGLSMFPSDGKSTADIINAADRALYEAKRRGKNCIMIAQCDHVRPTLHVVKKVSTGL